MIRAESKASRYITEFSNGTAHGISDLGRERGGQGEGFPPHDLLEAALAVCMNMTVRIYAEHHGIPIGTVSTTVSTEGGVEEMVLRCQVEIEGELDGATREKLQQVARRCPVRMALSKPIRFVD